MNGLPVTVSRGGPCHRASHLPHRSTSVGGEGAATAAAAAAACASASHTNKHDRAKVHMPAILGPASMHRG